MAEDLPADTTCLVVVFAAQGTQSWVAPRDLQLVGYSVNGTGGQVVSTDPTMTAAFVWTSQHIVDKLIAAQRSQFAIPSFTPLSWQVRKGDTIYFSADAQNEGYLYYL
jgi:hypothetical protein